MKKLWPVVLTLAIAFITILAIFSSILGWNIVLELLSHFQIQYFLILTVLLVILLFSKRTIPILISLFCCTLVALFILPWFIPNNLIVSDSNAVKVKILSANVNIFNNDYTPIINLIEIEQPDIAVLIEVNKKWVNQLEILDPDYPYSLGDIQYQALNVIVYSKRPLNNSKIDFWGETPHTSPVIEAQQTLDNTTFDLLAAHPLPPFKPSFFQSRNNYFDRMSEWARSQTNPIIIIGDLNITVWSPYYKKLIRETNLKNTRKGFGLLPTWLAGGMPLNWSLWMYHFFGLPIDHCLIDPQIQVSQMQVGPNVKSDHLPIVVDLTFPAQNS